MKKYIVITSIFSPTEAVKKFAEVKDIQLIVVGDKKTPINWNQAGVEYLSVENQVKSGYLIAKELPYNHYGRKMIGYLQAIKNGAEIIIDTDDDNIPYQNWGFPDFDGVYDEITAVERFVNIYQHFTEEFIWPRGLPLRCIKSDDKDLKNIKSSFSNIGVWQGLADNDPDVDAIYRLTSNVPCFFNKREPLVVPKGVITPFNSQNTSFRKELFPLLYLPAFVTFRFTDILRGLVAQPIMWTKDYKLGFTEATVEQVRNEHDYFKDFISEIPMYQYTERVIEIATQYVSSTESISNNLYNIYIALNDAKIVERKELELLELWLKDLQSFGIE